MSDNTAPLKIAIIGGGASGWAAAEALRQTQWAKNFDVVVYEKNHYFGGKCATVYPDGTPCNGQKGGYELGAGVISKGSQSNADLEALLQRHDIPYSNTAETQRKKYTFFVEGRTVDRKFLLKKLFRHPLRFAKACFGMLKFWWQLWRYTRVPQVDYQGRPAALNKTLSQTFPHEFNLCCGFGMQGFGYAHLEDKGLTPPLLYYHQYATPDVIINPVYTVDIGMQGIWAKVASTYAPEKARLNEEVRQVQRTTEGVYVETKQGKTLYDYLIVAVPLGPNLRFMDFDDQERALLSKVQTNHYVTVLCRVAGLTDIGNVNVLKTVDRREIGDVVFAYKRYPDSDWVSLNLYVDPQQKSSDADLLKGVAQNLRDDFAAELIHPEEASVYHWHDYFPHLGTEALDEGWYESFETLIQGKRRTLFVSSGLHMETVGASVQYATEKVKKIAPRWLEER